MLERIRLSQLVSRLQDFALGTLKNRPGASCEMSKSQVSAACFLIERRLARAQAPLDVALSGNITVVRRDPTQRPADYHRKGKASV